MAKRTNRRGRKPIFTAEQKRVLTRLVQEVVRIELRRWTKAI
jgi:hypothetical protein